MTRQSVSVSQFRWPGIPHAEISCHFWQRLGFSLRGSDVVLRTDCLKGMVHESREYSKYVQLHGFKFVRTKQHMSDRDAAWSPPILYLPAAVVAEFASRAKLPEGLLGH